MNKIRPTAKQVTEAEIDRLRAARLAEAQGWDDWGYDWSWWADAAFRREANHDRHDLEEINRQLLEREFFSE